MSASNQNPPESSDEQRFVERAMADIDKAEKFQKIKQKVVIGIIFGAVVWMVIREPGPGVSFAMVALVVVAGFFKLLFKIDNSTRAIIRAIENRR